jgi:predicted PurR-regulated permease PerM
LGVFKIVVAHLHQNKVKNTGRTYFPLEMFPFRNRGKAAILNTAGRFLALTTKIINCTMNNIIHDNKIRQVSFIAILLVLGWVLFRELQSFIPAFLGALTLYVIMRKWMFRLQYVRKWKAAPSALVLMMASFIVIIVPIGLVVQMLSSKINFAIQHSAEALNAIRVFATNMETKTGYTIVNEENIQKLSSMVATRLPSILGATFNTLTTIVVLYFILFFMLTEGRTMERKMYDILPMQETHLNKVGKEVKSMVIANALGIPLIAILQGIVGLIGYLILGVKEPFFWFIITCVTAMLPIVGAAVAYVTLAMLFFASGSNWQGFAMLAYGFIIIGSVDNIFRFALAKRIGNVHPLITIFGVIIGLNLFGFIGLIFGPLLISLFILLLKIYTLEFVPEK